MRELGVFVCGWLSAVAHFFVISKFLPVAPSTHYQNGTFYYSLPSTYEILAYYSCYRSMDAAFPKTPGHSSLLLRTAFCD